MAKRTERPWHSSIALASGALAALLVACDSGPDDDDALTSSETVGTELACDELANETACVAAQCHWLDIAGMVVDVDRGTCEPGEPMGLCYAPEQAQPCDTSAAACEDGTHVWALWGPDGGVILGRSPTSCDVAEGFVPCGAAPMNEAQTLACDCACEASRD